MLILTRKVDESISIGDDIRVYVLEVRGHQVCLGIEAPRDVPVYRDESFPQLQGSETLPPPSEAPLSEAALADSPPSDSPPSELPPYEPPEDELHG